MEEMKGTHWRTGGKLSHAGCEMLPQGNDIEYIVIERIEYKEREEVNGRIEKGVWVAYFAPNPYTKLPMILNSTNRKRIAKRFPKCNDYIDTLKNIAVRLTREKTRDVQDGGETWGLRISKSAPTLPQAPKKEVLTTSHAKWVNCVEWIAGGNDIASLRARYDISKEVEEQLNKEAQEKVGKK
jgi:hypothetical protein